MHGFRGVIHHGERPCQSSAAHIMVARKGKSGERERGRERERETQA
jgi:hypothetical protein